MSCSLFNVHQHYVQKRLTGWALSYERYSLQINRSLFSWTKVREQRHELWVKQQTNKKTKLQDTTLLCKLSTTEGPVCRKPRVWNYESGRTLRSEILPLSLLLSLYVSLIIPPSPNGPKLPSAIRLRLGHSCTRLRRLLPLGVAQSSKVKGHMSKAKSRKFTVA